MGKFQFVLGNNETKEVDVNTESNCVLAVVLAPQGVRSLQCICCNGFDLARAVCALEKITEELYTEHPELRNAVKAMRRLNELLGDDDVDIEMDESEGDE